MILRQEIAQFINDTAIHLECPNCAKGSTFLKPAQPYIDSCGFESYTFLCDYCGSLFSGVVDPFDDQLLASLLERHPGSLRSLVEHGQESRLHFD
jgi:hypothetical protein